MVTPWSKSNPHVNNVTYYVMLHLYNLLLFNQSD